MHIIGIDPGALTGVVVIETDLEKRPPTICNSMHLTSLDAAHWLDDRRYVGDYDVVMERFNLSPRTLRGTREGSLEALYTIGAIRFLCTKLGLPLYFQEPSAIKRIFGDDALQRLGYWTQIVGPHERDALRHALLHARTKGLWNGVGIAT
jgi:hypothetical protein